MGRRPPAGALLWFFGQRSATQKTTGGLKKERYYYHPAWEQEVEKDGETHTSQLLYLCEHAC